MQKLKLEEKLNLISRVSEEILTPQDLEKTFDLKKETPSLYWF